MPSFYLPQQVFLSSAYPLMARIFTKEEFPGLKIRRYNIERSCETHSKPGHSGGTHAPAEPSAQPMLQGWILIRPTANPSHSPESRRLESYPPSIGIARMVLVKNDFFSRIQN
jgi:hypothetical protein